MVTKYICERCGLTTEDCSQFREIRLENEPPTTNERFDLYSTYRLCNNCVNDIHGFIKHSDAYYGNNGR